MEWDWNQERARRIRGARGRLGLSQQEFADKLQVTVKTVSRWESGIAAPRPRSLRALVELTGKAIDWFSVVDEDASDSNTYAAALGDDGREDRTTVGPPTSNSSVETVTVVVTDPEPEPPDEYIEARYYEWSSAELRLLGATLDALGNRLHSLQHTELIPVVLNTRDAILATAAEDEQAAARLDNEVLSAGSAADQPQRRA